MRITRSKIRKKTEDTKDHLDKPLTKTRRREKKNQLRTSSLDAPVKLGLQPSDARAKKLSDVEDHFGYQPLSSRRNEIRLLRILPIRKFDGVNCGIECNIFHVSLDDLPDYDALSYVWGDRRDLLQISLDGHPFHVTANLHGALSRLRSSSMTRPVWIDAICINQHNLHERSEQVVKMGVIFKQAAKVITWLGDADSESELAFSLLQDLKDHLHDRSRCLELLKDQKNLEGLYGLYSLFYRDYWWRVWVIQEVTLAKTIIIFCGGDSFLWSDLVAIQETLARYHLRDIDIIAHGQPKLNFLRVSIESRGPRAMFLTEGQKTSDLTQTLLQHRFKDSSDPKDMIYSLVGLSNAHGDPRFVVDYSKSVCEVYTDVVEYVLATTKKLDIVCAIPRGVDTHRLPSWVPDWSFRGLGSSLLEHSSKHQFNAADASEAEAYVSSDKAVLHAKGIHLGNISVLGVTCGMSDLEDEQRAVAAIHAWQKLIAAATGDFTALAEVFCKNILKERYQAEEVKEWTTKSDFLQWIIGAFVRAMVVVCPDIQLDVQLASFSDYHAAWRSSEEDRVLGMIILKGTAEMMFGRRLIISGTGLLGLAPETVAIGDSISILLGCQLPIMLREEDERYTYLGEAFVDGYMYGKAMDNLKEGNHEPKTFKIQ